MTHPIFTLESLKKLGIVERNDNWDDGQVINYSFKIEEGHSIDLDELTRMKDTFEASSVSFNYYWDEEEEKSVMNIDLHYTADEWGLIE